MTCKLSDFKLLGPSVQELPVMSTTRSLPLAEAWLVIVQAWSPGPTHHFEDNLPYISVGMSDSSDAKLSSAKLALALLQYSVHVDSVAGSLWEAFAASDSTQARLFMDNIIPSPDKDPFGCPRTIAVKPPKSWEELGVLGSKSNDLKKLVGDWTCSWLDNLLYPSEYLRKTPPTLFLFVPQ